MLWDSHGDVEEIHINAVIAAVWWPKNLPTFEFCSHDNVTYSGIITDEYSSNVD